MAKCRCVHFVFVFIIILISVNKHVEAVNSKYSNLDRRDDTNELLKELRAERGQGIPLLSDKVSLARRDAGAAGHHRHKRAPDYDAFQKIWEVRNELPTNTPINEWILDQVTDAYVETFQPLPNDLLETPIGNISKECYNDIVWFIQDEANGVKYAVGMMASFGSYDLMVERYILTGQWRIFGDFDLCNKIRADQYDPTYQAPYDVKYCLQNMAGLKVGTCWPDSCSDEDLHWVAFTYLGDIWGPIFEPHVTCEVEVEWYPGSVATISIIAICIFIIVAATLYHCTFHHAVKKRLRKTEQYLPTEHNDATNGNGQADGSAPAHAETNVDGLMAEVTDDAIGHQEEESEVEEKPSTSRLAVLDRLILSSSIVRNTYKFFDCTVTSPDTLCLNGLRVISMWWIILGHCASMLHDTRIGNLWRAYEQFNSPTHKAVTESPFGVDTFFFLSGLLLAYNTLKRMAKNDGKINWGLFYFHRWWRITPTYMIVLAVWATLFLQWGRGPGHSEISGYINGACKDFWWTHFLYINNLYPFPGNLGLCMGWTWYLANDMQFFIISPLLLILLYKKPWKWGVGTIVGMCIVSFLVTISLVVYWGLGYSSTGLYNNRTLEDKRPGDDYIYAKPWCRIPAYLIGILFGYMLYRLKGKKVTLKRWQKIGGWILAVITGECVVYASIWAGPGTPQTASVFYNTFTRPAFAMAVAWVTFACMMGYGGIVNRFLSWTVWIPLGRLTFGAYLIHPMIIFWYVTTTKTTWHFSYTTFSYFYAASLVYSYAVAFVFALIIEGPAAGLEEVLLGKLRKGKPSKYKLKSPID